MAKRRPHLATARAQKLDDLSRPIKIHVCKDKTITYRRDGEPVFNGSALPVFSVDTIEEAQTLQLLCCACQYGEHPLMPGQNWYRLSSFEFPSPTLEVDDLDRVTVLLRERYVRIRRRAIEMMEAVGGTI